MTQLHFLTDNEMPIEPPRVNPHESKYQRFKRQKLDKSKIKIEMTNGTVITAEESGKMKEYNCMLCDKLTCTEDGLFKCSVTGEIMTHEGDATAYNCKHYKEWKE